MRLILVVSGLLGLSACVTVTEEKAEALQYRQQDWMNRYQDFKTACLRAGGHLITDVRGGGLTRNRKPSPRDNVACTRRVPRDNGGL